MEPKVAVCSRSFSQNKILREELIKQFPNTKFNDAGISLNGDSLVEFLKGMERAVLALEYLTEEVIQQLPELKVVGKYGVGLDKLDLHAMSKSNIKLGWTAGVNSIAVAELTIALALDIVRKVSESQAVVAGGEWTQVKGLQLSSLKVGVVGYGHVGSKVSRLFKAFGSDVVAYDIKGLEQEMENDGVTPSSWNKIVEECDLITVHVPYHKQNHHLISDKVMSSMKPGSYILNTARGGLIDEFSLLQHLESGHIHAAGLDVFEIEPPKNNALVRRSDVVVTSHIGGSSKEAILAMGRAAIAGLSDFTDPLDYL
ncbi:putative D-3-phosphoglycerate dehydrogenase [Alteromonas sp. 38]|nr:MULTISPECIES: NAD(P)-dependent oxidoreductase [unclassified Alteromonas]CAD5250198.1 putative D-3-phosphoglycerate dehydrogenase [Alteromonas sp. 154]VXC39213.1 putative D-3-phosphoglycerate dehydrogenase [Alteromonas sp. 38]